MADLITQIYNVVDPFEPLQPGDPAYVDCRDVRGDADVLRDLGREIVRSQRKTCQLFVGHRGGGKSTELLRLKAYLETQGCFVVYFAAIGDSGDMDQEDVQYADILLACTRHLLEDLRQADPKPVLNWLRDRLQSLQAIAQMEIRLDGLPIEGQITQFAKLTTAIRAVPSQRQEIRKQLDPHTVTLLSALNEFIADARRKLPADKDRLVVLVDNLDRIVPSPAMPNERINLDEIYLDRSDQLRGLDCHLVYTVPISMVYSNRAAELTNTYGDPTILPMIMVRTLDGQVYPPGLERMKAVLAQRVWQVAPDIHLETAVFETVEVLNALCLASGGHVRELLLLTQEAINYTDQLPIAARAVQRALSRLRDSYRRTVQTGQWSLLAAVAQTHRIANNDAHRDLLFRRCVLEYRQVQPNGMEQCWYDVHPLIRAIPEFREALEAL